MTTAAAVSADARLRSAKKQAVEDLLFAFHAQAAAAESGTDGYGPENIVGVGIGERHTGGRPTGELSVTVYVVVKAPRDLLESGAAVPPDYEGVPTDVVESGEFVATTQRGRYRPATGGVSAAHFDAGAGTLGFVARREGALCIVSNNHVFAREGQAAPGDAVVQPSRLDGGTRDNDTIGELAAWTPLHYDGTPSPVDAAVAETEPGFVEAGVQGLIDVVFEPLDAERGFVVRKCGRTSGLTRGHVYDPETTVKVRYQRGYVYLEDQFLVKGLDGVPFSDSGDSGSLVVEERSRRTVGLLCGGSPRFTIVTPLGRVLDALGLSLVS